MPEGEGGAPGLDNMLKNPKMKDALDKMGGMDGLASLMKDPNMMAMAQNMMKNPAMMQQAMSMMGGAGGSGGMPDMSALNDAMSSSGSTETSSLGKGKGKTPFKGFEE
jgi:hypothetical protein